MGVNIMEYLGHPITVGSVRYANSWQFVAHHMCIDRGGDTAECLRVTRPKSLQDIISSLTPPEIVADSRVTDYLVVVFSAGNLPANFTKAKGRFAKQIEQAVATARRQHDI